MRMTCVMFRSSYIQLQHIESKSMHEAALVSVVCCTTLWAIISLLHRLHAELKSSCSNAKFAM